MTAKTKLNTKGLDNLIKSSKIINGKVTQYGYFDGEIHQDSGLTLATLMGAHEYGDGVVERPVFKRTGFQLMDSLPKDVKPLAMEYLSDVVRGKLSPDDFLVKVGELAKKATQDNFGAGNTIRLAKNSPITIEKKGRNDPLVDSAELVNKMSVRVK